MNSYLALLSRRSPIGRFQFPHVSSGEPVEVRYRGAQVMEGDGRVGQMVGQVPVVLHVELVPKAVFEEEFFQMCLADDAGGNHASIQTPMNVDCRDGR